MMVAGGRAEIDLLGLNKGLNFYKNFSRNCGRNVEFGTKGCV